MMKYTPKEIGGYLELDKSTKQRLHKDAIALNCGRSCLAYLIHSKKIECIWLPYFLCGSVRQLCIEKKVTIKYYHINEFFLPVDILVQDNEWIYLVNYYGQLDNYQIHLLCQQYQRVIVDSTQAYFQMPLPKIDTLYSCRKFFGVPDGGLLYTDVMLPDILQYDYSYQRMSHILGRFEKDASSFYSDYKENGKRFSPTSIMQMSKLTDNLLKAIDYDYVKTRRSNNFSTADNLFKSVNRLNLKYVEGAFMYPLWTNDGERIRQRLIEKKIYIPILWPDVLAVCSKSDLEYDMAQNILPLPIDQRYDTEDMEYIAENLYKEL